MGEGKKHIEDFLENGGARSVPGNGNGERGEATLEVESARREAADKSPAKLLMEKEEEIAVLQDRLLRLAAETENTRKRLEREKADGISYANESLLRELLPVIDNLERALEHAENAGDEGALLEGVRMTLKGFLAAIAKHGCAPFESLGKPFDPNYHDAIMQQESADYPEKTVVQELQRGYVLNDRLLRPATVIVSKGPDV